ncbi:MAG TPA: carboxypeptidase regulatory-like domain-containing protein [Isosphaeraceae bacterium]
MRNRLPWTPLAMTLGLLAPNASRADITLVETVDVVPTSVVALPRTYYAPTSYVATSAPLVASPSTVIYDVSPTAYYVPTSYFVPTRYYVPTSYYVPTAYSYRRPFRRNRFVETAYLYEAPAYVTPTYYAAPRTYVPSSTVVSSSLCCESASPVVAAPSRSSEAAIEPMAPRPSGGTIESSAAGDPDEQVAPAGASGLRPITPSVPGRGTGGTSSAVGANPAGTNGNAPPANKGPGGAAPSGASPTLGTGSPSNPTTRDSRGVAQPPAPGSGNTPGSPGSGTGAATKGAGSAPPAPTPAPDSATPPQRPEPDLPPGPVPSPAAPADPLGLPSTDEAIRRSSNKPVLSTRDLRPLVQNILRGRVVSADTRVPETGVTVILVDRQGRFADRTTRTDANGRFSLALPEGDWTIVLTMPSGRELPVEEGLVTASAGKVSDRWGRELSNLVISR